jgi:hypothetical protein
MTTPNGHHPTAQDGVAEAVFQNYNQLGSQLGAIMTLLLALPLELMLAANKRHQNVSILLLPASVTADQANAARMGLLNDQRVIEGAIELRRILVAAQNGQP